jgi:hypothetical protein
MDGAAKVYRQNGSLSRAHVSGGVGGGVLMVIVGLIKQAMGGFDR